MWAEQRIVSSVAALLVSTVPLWMVLIDWARGGLPPGLAGIVGLLVGFAGIVVLVRPARSDRRCRARGPARGRRPHPGLVPRGPSAPSTAVGRDLPASPAVGHRHGDARGGVALRSLGTLTGEWARLDLSAITLPSLWGLVYLVVFGSLVGFTAYTWLLRVAPTTLVSTYAYVNPVVAILMGNLLASEPLTPRILLAAAVIVGSVALDHIQTGLRAQAPRRNPHPGG